MSRKTFVPPPGHIKLYRQLAAGEELLDRKTVFTAAEAKALLAADATTFSNDGQNFLIMTSRQIERHVRNWQQLRTRAFTEGVAADHGRDEGHNPLYALNVAKLTEMLGLTKTVPQVR